jgi:5-formyltetrahydrofolate cyclo-ligase
MAVPSPFPLNKSQARAEGLRRRRDFARTLSLGLREALESQLADRVVPHLANAKVVAGYHATGAEIGCGLILSRLGTERKVAFPWHAARDHHIVWRQGPVVETGPWGIMQPADDAPILVPDVVLVPLVMADRSGRRVGQGQGHYDRALAQLRSEGNVLAVGLAWERQISRTPLATEPFDMPLDALATPGEWIPCA